MDLGILPRICAACSSRWKLAATCTLFQARVEAVPLLESVNFSAAARDLPVHSVMSKSHRIARAGTWKERDSCASIVQQQGSAGGAKRAEPAHVIASRAFVTVTLAANMRGMWTQIVYEGKSGRVHPHVTSVPLSSSCPTPRRHWITLSWT